MLRPVKRKQLCPKGRCQPHLPPLRLTPYAMAKLLFLRDQGETEVGGFGVSAPADLLLVRDVQLVEQRCSQITVCFADSSVADFFDHQVDQGRGPQEFARIWIHTHPGDSAYPSATDEATFERCFGSSDWAVMFILARRGQTYARLRFQAGPGGQVILPVEVDFGQPFPAADQAAWVQEYQQNVCAEMLPPVALQPGRRPIGNSPDYRERWPDDPWSDLILGPEVPEPSDEPLAKPF